MNFFQGLFIWVKPCFYPQLQIPPAKMKMVFGIFMDILLILNIEARVVFMEFKVKLRK